MVSYVRAAIKNLVAAFSPAIVIAIAALVIGPTIVLACTPEARATAAESGIEIAVCVAENQDLPEPAVIAKCIKDNVTPAVISNILAQQRAITARAAKRAACGSVSPGGSSNSPDAGTARQ